MRFAWLINSYLVFHFGFSFLLFSLTTLLQLGVYAMQGNGAFHVSDWLV